MVTEYSLCNLPCQEPCEDWSVLLSSGVSSVPDAEYHTQLKPMSVPPQASDLEIRLLSNADGARDGRGWDE